MINYTSGLIILLKSMFLDQRTRGVTFTKYNYIEMA